MKPTKPLLTWEERKARREERRAKQREANAGRAKKMRVVRLAFEKEHASEPTAVAPEPPRINVGCSGWFYWPWRERFYPRELPTKNWFPHYAKQFDTVELNAPFYSWPTINTVQCWVRQAQAAHTPFFYTIKACELITHVKRFARTATYVRDFSFIADLLRPHMGCFLFQLPPSFKYTPARLKHIIDQLDPSRRNVVEFRHKSWWNTQTKRAFKKNNIIFCSTSGPRLPDELVQTADEIYVRFHGLKRWYRHDYTNDELAIWVKRIRDAKPKRVWAYFNNDRDANAPRNAVAFREQLSDVL